MKWHTSYLAPFLHDRQHAALQIPTTDHQVFWWHTHTHTHTHSCTGAHTHALMHRSTHTHTRTHAQEHT